jgi:hypothetical protein
MTIDNIDKDTDKERPYFNINEQMEDWLEWVPIPLKPEWLNEQIIKECKGNIYQFVS